MMFSWGCRNFLKQQKHPPEVFHKRGVLKNFAIFTKKPCVGASLVSLESTLLTRDSITNGLL